jgi:hypothetical protein
MTDELHQYSEVYEPKSIMRRFGKEFRAIPEDAANAIIEVRSVTSIWGHKNWRLSVQYEAPVRDRLAR